MFSSPTDEDLLAVATTSGTLFVIDCELSSLKKKEKLISRVTEHKAPISDLVWDERVSTTRIARQTRRQNYNYGWSAE